MIPLSMLKDYLQLDGADATYDTLLATLEANAVAFVEQQTSRYFRGPAAVTETLPGNDSYFLYLWDYPSASGNPTSVTQTSFIGATGLTITASEADGFEVRLKDYEAKLARKGTNIWLKTYEYAVSYTRGYTVTATGTTDDIAAPSDIRQLVMDLVALKFAEATGGTTPGLKSETIDNYSYTRGDFTMQDLAALPGAMDTIRHWRRITI